MPIYVTNSQAFPNLRKTLIFYGARIRVESQLRIFSSENCYLSGMLNKLMQLKRITNGGRRQAIFVIFRKKTFLTPFK